MYKTYKKYKPSGVEWIDEIPEHWEDTLLKYSLDDIISGGTPSTDKSDYWSNSNEGIAWVSISDITKSNGSLMNTEKKISLEGLESKKLRIIPKGTLLISIFASLGKSTLLEIDAAVNQAILGLLTQKKLVRDYLKYYLIFIEKYITYYSHSNTQDNLNLNKIKNLPIPLPPHLEQTQIANYLDQKTAQIDGLIAKRERLIKLLEEEKTAVINEAVTKGINPNVKLKDSGIEWLGKIPEHWELKKWRYLFKIVKNIAGQIGLNILSITQKGIKIKNIKNNDGQLSSDYSKYQIVNKDDFAMNSMDLLTGFIDISKYEGVTSPDYKVFKLVDSNSVGKYYLYIFQMNYKKKVFYSLGRGAAMFGRWRLPTDELKQFLIPCPPKEEQIKIVKHIKKETTRIGKKIETTKKLIELLKEYRTALISEAVTGKIDVRDSHG